MNNGMKIKANFGRNTNKHKNKSFTIPKSSESFVWKDTNWRKFKLRLNIVQTEIYVAIHIIETYHIKPIARGDSHKITNLQLLHAVCHDKK